jgi:hypothetical protein
MNIVFRHLREKYVIETCCDLLIKHNEGFVRKYLKEEKWFYLSNDKYLTHCVKEFPLDEKFCSALPPCKNAEAESLTYRLGMARSCKCLYCWYFLLEKNESAIDKTKYLPSFLKQRKKPDFLK